MDFAIFQEFFYVFYVPVLTVALIGFVAASFFVAVCLLVKVIIFRPERG